MRSREWQELSAFIKSRHRGRYLRASALGCATAFGFLAACFSFSSSPEAVASWWVPLCAIAIGGLYAVRTLAWRRVVREELGALILSPVCFSCGYSLKGLDLDERSHALCPECGRRSPVMTAETRRVPSDERAARRTEEAAHQADPELERVILRRRPDFRWLSRIGGALFAAAWFLASGLAIRMLCNLECVEGLSDRGYESLAATALVVMLGGTASVWAITTSVVRSTFLARELDRLGAERVCPWCEYSLRGLPTDDTGRTICPECGRQSLVATKASFPSRTTR